MNDREIYKRLSNKFCETGQSDSIQPSGTALSEEPDSSLSRKESTVRSRTARTSSCLAKVFITLRPFLITNGRDASETPFTSSTAGSLTTLISFSCINSLKDCNNKGSVAFTDFAIDVRPAKVRAILLSLSWLAFCLFLILVRNLFRAVLNFFMSLMALLSDDAAFWQVLSDFSASSCCCWQSSC